MRIGGGWLPWLVASLAAAACTPARTRIDPAVAERSEEWQVDGASPRRWDAPLRVGPYHTSAVRDGGTVGWSAQVLGLAVTRGHRPYAWRMTGPGAAVDAECHELSAEATTARDLVIDVRAAGGRPALACAFHVPGPGGATGTWSLTLSAVAGASPGFSGALREHATGAEYAIMSTHELEGSAIPLGEPAGYALTRGADAVAVIERLGSGRLWVARGARDLPAIAAASVALLLFGAGG